MNIKKSILKVFSANVLQLLSSLIIGFVVPAILNIENYANLKTYALYISYVGFLHLGFPDGLLIKYGGKKYAEIDKGTLKGEHNFLFIFQLIVSCIFLIMAIILKNPIVILFSISILPIMMQCFHKNIAQATGDFNKYSKIMYSYTISYLICNVFLALIFREENYIYYCMTTFSANLISVVLFEYRFLEKNRKVRVIIDKKDILASIKTGFSIMLANLIVIGLFSIDKWFIKLFFSTEEFAHYSFAVSMLNIINTLVSAISITFYNYLFLNNNEENINRLKKYLMVLGGMSSICYFPLAIIINMFIAKYNQSLNIIAITFSSFPYMILINALYVNLYKVNKNEKKYLKLAIIIMIISIILNLIATFIFKNTIAIAIATILTLIIWNIYSSKDLEKVRFDKRTNIYLFGITIVFLICSCLIKNVIGGIVYIILFIIFTYIFDKRILKELIDIGVKIIKRKELKNEEN